MRWLFHIISVLSFLTCIASTVIWKHGYSAVTNLYLYSPGGTRCAGFVATSGLVRFHFATMPLNPFDGSGKRVEWEWNNQNIGMPRDTIGTDHDKNGSGGAWWGITLRCWMVTLAFAILPPVWLVSVIRTRRRFTAGACRNCGYDLRATPDRCPECGMLAEAISARQKM